MEVVSKGALFASHQPFASMTLSIAELLTATQGSEDGLFVLPASNTDCNSLILEHLDVL